MTTTISFGTQQTTCTFDSGQKKHVCNLTNTSTSTTTVDTSVYNSVSDFVNEADRPGMRLYTSKSDANSTYIETNTFNGINLASNVSNMISIGIIFTETYTVWDNFGRPTAGTMHIQIPSNSTDCNGLSVDYSYDDTARTWTRTYGASSWGTGTNCPTGAAAISTLVYDETGGSGSALLGSVDSTVTTNSTTEVCY